MYVSSYPRSSKINVPVFGLFMMTRGQRNPSILKMMMVEIMILSIILRIRREIGGMGGGPGKEAGIVTERDQVGSSFFFKCVLGFLLIK